MMNLIRYRVIDWDWVSLAPLPAIIHHPWFIADIPGWYNERVAEGDSFAEDRLFLENALKSKESEREELSQHLPVKASTLLCGSGKRLLFQSGVHYKGIHERFVEMHCARTGENLEAARLQLDAVLRLYPELVGMEQVQRVKDLLGGEPKDV